MDRNKALDDPRKSWMPALPRGHDGGGRRKRLWKLCVGLTLRNMMSAFVYIMANGPNGVLYVGVTSDLTKRVHQHRTGASAGFTQRYGVKTLVWYEAHDSILAAIAREKALKHWSRARKVRLIHDANRDWRDLWPDICG